MSSCMENENSVLLGKEDRMLCRFPHCNKTNTMQESGITARENIRVRQPLKISMEHPKAIKKCRAILSLLDHPYKRPTQ